MMKKIRKRKNPVGKVYINIRKLIADFEKKEGKKISRKEIAEYLFQGNDLKSITLRTKFRRKIEEDSKYELTLTESWNLALFFKLNYYSFIRLYTKAI